ncbi:hypothetical protein FB451DRAFT_1401841 [Mycena latifolia]|nr:hypothetical protein FB451DRAFT_1401841 [Mycena latifolia]
MESEDEDDGWATATESEEYHDATTDLEVVFSEVACATSAKGVPSAPQVVEAAVECGSSTVSVPSMDEATTAPVASQGEEPMIRDTVKKGVADMLSTPLEVKLHLRTPMDILLWSLVVILSLLVAVLGVALAVLWSRVQ